jgi:hypothetical protein
VRWRGSFETAIYNVRHNIFEVFPNLFSRNAKRFYALSPCPRVAPLVPPRTVTKVVCQSIHLDRKSSRLAEEVEHEWPEWMLPSELQAMGAQPKHPPESDL